MAGLRYLVVIICALAGLVSPTLADESDIVVNVDQRDGMFHIDSNFEVAVPVRIAWRVLTDFEHMADILGNLNSSRIVSRSGNTLHVAQEGVAHFGPFRYTFSSEREIRLEPMTRILARQIAGNTRHYASTMEIDASATGTHFHYHAEMALDSGIARFLGGPFIRHEIAEQFVAMASEMERRHRDRQQR